METIHPDFSTPFDLSPYIGRLKLTGEDSALVASVLTERHRLNAIAAPYGRDGRKAMKQATWNLTESPIAENAEKLADAILREKAAEDIFKAVQHALKAPHDAAADRLIPVALRQLDAIEAAMRKDADEHDKLVGKSVFAGQTDSGEVKRKLTKTIELIDAHREDVRKNHKSLALLIEWDLVSEDGDDTAADLDLAKDFH